MSYIYSNKQTFQDQFIPIRSTKARQVRYSPTSSPTTSIQSMIQFSQIGPRDFRDVMTNIKFICKLKITYTMNKNADTMITYKNFNYAITQCQVSINGSNSLSIPLSILAPVYENYNKKYAHIYNKQNEYNDTVYLKSRKVTKYKEDGDEIENADDEAYREMTDEIYICTPIYHPWLCAPYLGGINNMDVSFNINLLNIVANTGQFTDMEIESFDNVQIIYDTYRTDNEIFSILLPYFKYTEKLVEKDKYETTFNTTDLKTAPLKIFISGTYDYTNTKIDTINRVQSFEFSKAQFNINNITDAYNSNSIMALYNVSQNAGYLKSFTEFVGSSDNHLASSGATPLFSYRYTFNPCCIGLDLKYIDVDIGTDDLFRFEGTLYYTSDDIANRKLFVVYMYPSLFVSTRTKTDIITAESLVGKELLSDFDYEDFDDFYGFGFWDKLKGGISKAIKFIKDKKLISNGAKLIGNTVGNVHPGVKAITDTVGNISDSLGFSTKAF